MLYRKEDLKLLVILVHKVLIICKEGFGENML